MAIWDKVKASKDGSGFSQMFFADDLLLFAKANDKNSTTKVWKEFNSLAGQWHHWKFLAIWGKTSSPFVSEMWHVISGLLDKNHKNSLFFLLTSMEESMVWKNELVKESKREVVLGYLVQPMTS